MMLSRVAENLYWMARYLERAENTARLIDTTTSLLLDLPKEVSFGWVSSVRTLGAEALFQELYSNADEREVMAFLITDPRNPNSIYVCLDRARENARTLREVLPREASEHLNTLYFKARKLLERNIGRRERHQFLQDVIRARQGIVGMLAGTMMHDMPYQFLKLGRNLERADMTTRILDMSTEVLLPVDGSREDDPYLNLRWMSMLKSLSAYQAYRHCKEPLVNGPDVVNFLIKERLFPRAVAHCLHESEGCLRMLPLRDSPLAVLSEVEEIIARTTVGRLANDGLHEFIDDLQVSLNEVHKSVVQTYFPKIHEAPPG